MFLSGRHIRYVMFAVVALAVFYFISSSSLPLPGNVVSKITPGTQEPDGQDKQDTPAPAEESEKPTSQPAAQPPVQPASQLANATFVTLARNTDVWEVAKSIRHIEDRFNKDYHYSWVFLNDGDFDDTFKEITSNLVSGKTHYGKIPREHWSFPEFIDQDRAAEVRKEMKQKQVIYGDSISYRHMCRYESGFFFRHELMNQFEFYWRVEPSIEYFCDIPYDPFRFMQDNKKKYSFVLSLFEYKETVATLWDSAKKFMQAHPEHIAENNNLDFISSDGGETYNLCHFWSNFEIGSLNWLRSKAYLDYFESLDKDGGFFYERWGDAPVHSIAAALMLSKDEIHFFDDIAYRHVPFLHCPNDPEIRKERKCHCNPDDSFDWNGYSCTARWFDTAKLEKPAGSQKKH
ncbi:hypothetical protein AJ80_01463 [Polytolypa hystricis UAMH7299]|uniref:Alpha-1,2 mannosyltransferase KTR1 n=1 Tax=Polytolypa hystricis (strain UAMH7299) TaxID=1447883 RepID=A0A2B7Z0N5_POLH7|nr:hypothetical protein AJ80_01463 [Polytolypa hystricis UAMH7299]